MKAFTQWAKAYRKTAAADGYRELTERLEEEGWTDVEDIGRRAVDATVFLVETVAGFQDPNGLLPLQVYRAADVRAKYTLSFQGGRHDLTRLYCDELDHVDLAEVHDDGVGFQLLTIERSDEKAMSRSERAGLKAQVKRDLEEDFGDEIALSFSGKGSFLQVEGSLERGAR